MKKRKKTICIILVLVMLATLTGCGIQGDKETSGTSNADTTQAGSDSTAETQGDNGSTRNSMTISYSNDVGTFRAYESLSKHGKTMYGMVAESLFEHDENLIAQPLLVDTYEMDDDGMGMTLHLRKGVLFHSGDEMKASDVVFTFQQYQKSSYASSYPFLDWDGIKANGDYDVYIPFVELVGPITDHLTGFFIYSEKFETSGSADLIACGTGPFKVQEYKPDDQVVYVRNDDYWGDMPRLETITLRFIGEAATSFVELQTGGVDISYSNSNSSLADVLNGEYENLKVYSSALMSHQRLAMNYESKPFDNVLVRRALNYAINREAIFLGAYDGLGNLAYSCISVDVFGFDESLRDNYPYDYNVEKAKELLAEAGYADGFTTTFIINESDSSRTIAEMVANMLGEVGITVEIQQYETLTYEDKLWNSLEYGLAIGSYNQNGDPANALTQLTHAANGIIGGNNPCKNNNDPKAHEYSDFLDQANASFDLEERAQLYQQMQGVYIENIWDVPLVDQAHNAILGLNIEGYWGGGVMPHFEDAYFMD